MEQDKTLAAEKETKAYASSGTERTTTSSLKDELNHDGVVVSKEGGSADAAAENASLKEQAAVDQEDESQYLTGIKLYLVMLGLGLCCLLVGLDNSILATAIPTITTAFNSLGDVGWYGSAFLITVCALQPTAGRIFTYFSLKWGYLAFLFVFEVGSLLCAVAQNSTTLIVGRAIAGLGASGLFSGALVIVGNMVVLRMRPLWTGILLSCFGLANVIGPLLGAAFTEHASWRWCFYINLPLGGITAAVLVFFFETKERPFDKLPLKEKISHLDLPGLGLFMPAIIMLLLVLQWGGHEYAWRSSTIIGLIVGFVVLILLFIAWQWRQQDEASIPPRIFMMRSVWSACLILAFGLGSVILVVFYLPMWFQIIKQDSPIQSGVRFLPTVLANFLASMISGALITGLGWYNPWLYFGSILTIIASAVFTTWDIHESNSMIIGIQILIGASAPLLIQTPLIGLMAILPEIDLPIASALGVFFQFLGGAIFLAIAENIFISELRGAIPRYAPQIDANKVVEAGAVGLMSVVTVEDLPGVILAYNDGIMAIFYLGIAGGAMALIFSFFMEWKSVKGKQVVSAA